MDRIRDIYLRRADLFLDPGHFNQLNIHQHQFKRRDGTAVQLSVWSAPMDNDREPPTFHQAVKQTYKPTQVGDEFGPSWSTHWFKVRVDIPKDEGWSGEPIIFRWEAGCEGMVWSGTGVPLQAFSEQERDEFLLTPSAQPGDTFEFYIEMAVNGMFGTGGDESRTARIRTAEIAIIDEPVRLFCDSLRIVVDMAKSLPKDSTRSKAALEVANNAINVIDYNKLELSLPCGQAMLSDFLGSPGALNRFEVFAVGNCHIDTAWLWRYRETKRKCARSWASQLRLLERHPSYVFACPQMQQLDWLKDGYPSLFKEIQSRVREGRFVPVGGSWVEMDGNMPSGESFVRHFLYGQSFMRDHFDGQISRIFWLPDTFGYNPQLPQLMSLAGMDYFLTQKLSWSNINKFPHHSFQWEGLDGTRVIAHFPPADTYTSNASVGDVIKSETGHSEAGKSPYSMLLFGHGDGGGGPTDAMLRRLELIGGDIDGLPRLRMTGPLEFFQNLQTSVLPVWRGELYLELHRGTLTSQAKIKYYNRKCEGLLREAELVSTIVSILGGPAYPAADLERLWKLVLLNQFHDVLPGSSIEAVYHDVSQIYQSVEYETSRIRELAIRDLFRNKPKEATVQSDLSQQGQSSIVFFNSVPFERSEVIIVPFDPDPNSRQPGILLVESVPGLAMSCLAKSKENAQNSAVVKAATHQSGYYLENSFVRVEVDQHGCITSYYDKSSDRQLIDPFKPANSFWLYEDKPNAWDAWDLEIFYSEKGHCVDKESTVQIGMEGPLLASLIRICKISPTSTMTQIISLSCLSPTIEFYCSIDWSESHRILRVLHPFLLRSDQATYETAFGQVKRPTHTNTSWDAAQFEVCGHRFMDLSEPDYGVALLNDCKYGHSCHGNVMGLSLLRAPKYPDPTCDQSKHIIRFALFPHSGPLDQRVVGEAYKFNNPLRWTSVPAGSYDPAWLNLPFLHFSQPNGLVIDTLKMAEDGSGDVILRAYESQGGRGQTILSCHPLLKIERMEPCDLLEAPSSLVPFSGLSLSYLPFQIISLRLSLSLAP